MRPDLSALDPADVFARVAHLPGVAFLDSSDRLHPEAARSVIGISPARVVRTLDSIPPPLRPRSPREYGPGLIGFISYEAGREFERIPARSRAVPHPPAIHMAEYDSLLVFDHRRRTVRAEGVRAEREWGRLIIEETPRRKSRLRIGRIEPQFARSEYLRRVQAIRRHIRDGDIYQANLTMSFSAAFEGDPADLYIELRRQNPAPYAAFIRAGRLSVLSFSPELFLRYDGETVETHPIKGTARRCAGERDDAARHALRTSAKERAELAMIVDVERNDLARICKDVRVEAHGRIESFAGLHHAVTTVKGTARGLTAREILRATFPGGSVTGAPKIRAMEILAGLEREERGVYTGAVGYIGDDGSLVLNLAIRTIIAGEGVLRFNAGGGITWDSDPAAEYDEMMAKTEVIRSVLGGIGRESGRASVLSR